MEVVRAAVLVTEAFRGREAALKAVEAHLGAPTRVLRSDRTLIATWEGPFEEAMVAAASLEGARLICSAVNVGAVTLIKEGTKTVPSGSAVQEGLAALRVALPGRTSLPGESAQSPEVRQATAEGSGRRLLPGPDIGGRQDFLVEFPERAAGLAAPELLAVHAGGAVPADEEDLSGALLEGRYALTKKLGGGGFGSVYAADGFAMGLLIYRSLAGRLPFQDDGGLRKVFRRQTSQIPPLDDLSPHALPPGLVSVVTRALHRDPADRWPSAQQMRAAWLGCFEASPDEARWRQPRLDTPTQDQMAAYVDPDAGDTPSPIKTDTDAARPSPLGDANTDVAIAPSPPDE